MIIAYPLGTGMPPSELAESTALIRVRSYLIVLGLGLLLPLLGISLDEWRRTFVREDAPVILHIVALYVAVPVGTLAAGCGLFSNYARRVVLAQWILALIGIFFVWQTFAFWTIGAYISFVSHPFFIPLALLWFVPWFSLRRILRRQAV